VYCKPHRRQIGLPRRLPERVGVDAGTGRDLRGTPEGYHPRGDRKSAQSIENTRVRGPPMRKRVRNRMKIWGLQGCDKKEGT